MGIDRAELRSGLAETRQYILSHHPPSQYDRCYAPVVGSGTVHICARCAGIYPGIAAGLLAFALAPAATKGMLLVAVLPIPALVDWVVTTLLERRGYNVVRTVTGAALGYGYGLGLGHLFVGGDIRVVLVGAAYALLAGVALLTERANVSAQPF